jgi:transcription initiation factor TFIID subunit 12
MDNSNLNQNRPPQPAPHQQASLIRVEQVRKLPHLSDPQKVHHEGIVKKFWDLINSNPVGSSEYTAAYTKLSQLSNVLMQAMKQYQAKARAQGQGQGQPVQPGVARPQPGGNATVSFDRLSPEIQERVNQTRFIYPPAMIEGSKPAEDWLREAKARYGHALQRSEVAKQRKNEIQKQASLAMQSGNELTPQQKENYNQKIAQCQKAISESESFMAKFKEQQAQFQRNQPQHRFSAQGAPAGPVDTPDSGVPAVPVTNVQGPTAHSISSAVSAARNQAAANANQTATSPQAPTSQTAPNATPTQSIPPNMNHSPYHPQPHMDAVNGLNRPLSHQAPPQAHPQQPPHPQSAAHAHPPNYLNPTKKDDRQPITKNLQVTSPNPVPVPPARPTLSGGPNGMAGQMAMPAISSYPGYVLESSEDGRLLSKKKLNELVREVCGPGAEEQLTPEVEEVSELVVIRFPHILPDQQRSSIS